MEKFERTHSAQEFEQMKNKFEETKVEIKTPTCGRMVHYYPNNNDTEIHAIGGFVPATILDQINDLTCNMIVLHASDDKPCVMRWSIPHKSLIVPNDSKYGLKSSYWDWPKIN